MVSQKSNLVGNVMNIELDHNLQSPIKNNKLCKLLYLEDLKRFKKKINFLMIRCKLMNKTKFQMIMKCKKKIRFRLTS